MTQRWELGAEVLAIAGGRHGALFQVHFELDDALLVAGAAEARGMSVRDWLRECAMARARDETRPVRTTATGGALQVEVP